MIFVSVGTTGFDELIQKVDCLATYTGHEFIAQIGPGDYEPQHCEFFRYKPSVERYYHQADVIVSHGGLATVTEVLRLGKPLVSVEDHKQPDRHQQEILSIWAEQHFLLWCKDLNKLETCINHARTVPFESYTPPECHIQDIVTQFIDSL